jgi:hypothetical protein
MPLWMVPAGEKINYFLFHITPRLATPMVDIPGALVNVPPSRQKQWQHRNLKRSGAFIGDFPVHFRQGGAIDLGVTS